MSKWGATWINGTFTNVADAANFVNGGQYSMTGGSSTQSILTKEYYMGGLATVTSPMQVIFARTSTLPLGLTVAASHGNTLVAFDPATAALAAVPVAGDTDTTRGQRSSTLYLQAPAFNANGGIVRWLAGPDEEPFLLGNTASFGGMGFTTVAGTIGAINLHWIVEPK